MIKILSYNETYEILRVLFTTTDTVYEYQNVTPYMVKRLEGFIKRKNWSRAVRLLKNISTYKKLDVLEVNKK